MNAVTIKSAAAAYVAAENIRKGAGSLAEHSAVLFEAVYAEGISLGAIATAAGNPGAKSNVGYWAAVGAILDACPEAEAYAGNTLAVWQLVKTLGRPTVDEVLATDVEGPAVWAALQRVLAAKQAAKAAKAAKPAEGDEPTKPAKPGKQISAMSPAEVLALIERTEDLTQIVGGVEAWLAEAAEVARKVSTVRAMVDAATGTDREITTGGKSVVHA